ncbi:WW domain-containing oxidoreductase-like isoform X3 [Pectinophora gossypiella]|uniref:WW domain-containing oxidoreductase-like isoform X3 n=1 Tax=Pectinophora gossypiella TaxID=13191 RepID=UPI00214F1710|nr:WW domain-containing oxidoreductase-like isoform X3 [Pectinophora gossypiella]
MRYFYRIFSNLNEASRITKQIGTLTWADKLFINYVKMPQFLKIHGPTGYEVTKDIDLTGKTCLITGGTSGIGLEIIKCLVARNCKVITACRNPYAAKVISNNVWGDQQNLDIYTTDLKSLKSVKQCSDQILARQENLKWAIQDTITPTQDLLSLPREEYTSIKAYNISKLCGILAMHYLSYRWLNKGRSVFCAHPGSFVKTKLCSNWWVWEALYTLMIPFSKSIPQAAATPLYCATSPDLQGLSDLYIKDLKDSDESELAKNTHLAFRVIELSREIIRERIAIPEESLLTPKKVEYIEKPVTTTIEPDQDKSAPEPAKSSVRETVLNTSSL